MAGIKWEGQDEVDPNLLKPLQLLPIKLVLDWYYTGIVVDISIKKRISSLFFLI
jgi:hypothetical protein